MKTPWERAPLDEAVFLQEGPGIRSYEYQSGGYPMINVRCVQDGYIDLSTCNSANLELATGKWKHFQVQEGDILFTISGSIGRTAIVKKKDLPLLMNTSVVRFRSKTARLKDDFFFFYLQTEEFLGKLHALSSGTAQKNVGPTHLKTLDVPLPPLDEQERIVSLLVEAFEVIAIAKSNARKALSSAHSLFESHLQSVFAQGCTGWAKTTLGDACQFSSGLWKGKKPPFINAGVIRNTNFTKEGRLDYSNIAYLEVEAKSFERRRLRFGDIILEKSGGGPKQPVGRVSLFDKEEGEFSFSNFTAAIRIFDSGTLDFRFLHKYLYWIYLSGVTEGMQNHSTGIRNLNSDAYKAIQVAYPPLADQRRIAARLDSFQDEAQCLTRLYERKLAALEELKKSLLHQAFNGEL